MNRHGKNAVIIVIAIFCIVAGIIGLALPFLPGILLIVVGLLLISAFNPRFEYWLNEKTAKYPPLHKIAKDMQAFIERIIGKS